jgi:hypothetical protein
MNSVSDTGRIAKEASRSGEANRSKSVCECGTLDVLGAIGRAFQEVKWQLGLFPQQSAQAFAFLAQARWQEKRTSTARLPKGRAIASNSASQNCILEPTFLIANARQYTAATRRHNPAGGMSYHRSCGYRKTPSEWRKSDPPASAILIGKSMWRDPRRDAHGSVRFRALSGRCIRKSRGTGTATTLPAAVLLPRLEE